MDTPTEAQRLRAARVLADLTVEQLAGRIAMKGLSAKTLGAIERSERQLRDHEIPIVSKATGVPEWFLRDGFEEPQQDPDLAERVEALEAKLQTALGLARTRDERVATLEHQMETVAQLTERLASLEHTIEPIIDLAGERTVHDLANAAEPQEQGGTGGASEHTGHQPPGQGTADRSRR